MRACAEPTVAAVLGCGAICAAGATFEACLEALAAGRVQPIGAPPPPTSLADPPAVFVVEGEPCEGEAPTRTARLAIAAAREAWRRARGPTGSGPDPARVGVVVGTTVGCTFEDEPFYRDLLAGLAPEASSVRRFEREDLASQVAEALGLAGPRLTVATACASGADAIAAGARWVASGRCDAVVAGGADALARYPYLGFYRLQNCSPERCRPFDLDRRGLNLGEGAAFLVLESARRAGKRGPAPLAALVGHGSAADAHHPTAPHPEGRGLRLAVARALERGGAAPGDVAFANAHGTGTADNDRVEGRVLADLLPATTPVLSTKGYTGHTLGAAGALEAAFAVGHLLRGEVPASAGFATPDPDCRVVPTTAPVAVDRPFGLSTSLAFGGANTALLFRRWPP